MLSQFLAVCLALVPIAQCIQIHEHMTEKEVLKTFQTGSDNVPEYEVVQLYHTLHKRDINDNSTRMVKFNARGRNFSLYFEPTNGLLAGVSTPVWTVEADAGEPEGLKYTQQPNVLANIGRPYQCVSKRSAIVAYEGEDGETLIHGDLLEDLRVVPLPHRLRDTILRYMGDLVDILPDGVEVEADFRRSHHHVVFKSRERDMNANHDGIRLVKRKRISSEVCANNRSETSIPDIVYPEILIIVDSSLYKTMGKNIEEVARYVLAFWNGVDLRYRLLEEPIIRLNIAGIIVSPELRGTPYLHSNQKKNSKIRDVDIVLQAMGNYFYRESYRFPFETYDFAMLMTRFTLCTMKANGLCDKWGSGVVPAVGGACNRNHVNMSTEAVGIIRDVGGYAAISAAAHEVGHLMGSFHDGEPESLDCPAADSYLMEPFETSTHNRFQFSKCSLKQFYDFLSSPNSTCLRNKPQAGQALPRLLPGQLLTADEQCQKIGGRKACNQTHSTDACTRLLCHFPGLNECGYLSAPADGTSCGNEMYCINGYCVSKNAKQVPYRLTP